MGRVRDSTQYVPYYISLVGGIRNALPRANVTFETGFRRSMDVISANS
jgi:hypothetical protein